MVMRRCGLALIICSTSPPGPVSGVPGLRLVGRREEWSGRNRPQRLPAGAVRALGTPHVSGSDSRLQRTRLLHCRINVYRLIHFILTGSFSFSGLFPPISTVGD